MNRDEIAILAIYIFMVLNVLWFEFSPREIGLSGEYVLTAFQMIQFASFMVIVPISFVTTLILGWSGLNRPRYGLSKTARQYCIYWLGIAPTILFSVTILLYGVYIIGQANI